MNSYEIIMIILTALAVIIDLIKLNNGNKIALESGKIWGLFFIL